MSARVLIALALWLGPVAGVALADGFPSTTLLKKPDDWYRSEAGRRAVANVLSHPSDLGSWPKNLDTSASLFEGDRSQLKGTFDNAATTGEARFLARAFRVTGDDRCRREVEKAVDHILAVQYPTGGWPQFFPPGPAYHRHITFNDDTMVGGA